MPAPETWLAGVVLAALTLYALSGGADFGGGVWDLFARGRAGERQRELIAHAIAPIWEANHVWLILVVVLLFVCFPLAFAAIGTALHVPLTLMLLGVVARGSAFTFRTYDSPADPVRRRWSRVFAIASVVTPVMLGVCVGAVASGRIHVDPASGRVITDFVTPWLAPFPFAIGALALALFAFLAAVYLTLETTDAELREAFRRRALRAAIVVAALAALGFALSRHGAPRVHLGLAHRDWSLPFHLATGGAALGAFGALLARRWRLARALAVAQVALVLWGWGFSQYPWIVPPDLSIANAAAPRPVLRLVLGALAAGAVLLLPALGYLFRLFKAGRASPGTDAAA